MAPYKYTPISTPRTIRLLHLHPGTETDPVHLSLVITPLDGAPEYESISYCWDNALDLRDVTCNGDTLTLTKSLFTGLEYFRHPVRDRVLWADAVCIDQADAAQKGAQVLLMPYIYARATSVLVWLGLADDPVHGSVPSNVADSIQQILGFLPEFDPENAAETEEKAQDVRRESERLFEEGKPGLLSHDWRPLAGLLKRPWFRRRWVVQEVSLAKEAVLYVGGGVEVKWIDLARLSFGMEVMGVDSLTYEFLDEKEKEATRDSGGEEERDMRDEVRGMMEGISFPLHAVAAILMVQMFRDRGTLLDGIICTMSFFCTDPRDHIYSLQSLVSHGPKIQPDYEAGVGDVFRRFAIATLVQGRSLKLLSLAPDRTMFPTPDTKRLEGLPSWVPDLRLLMMDVLASYTVRPQAFFAGGRGEPTPIVSRDERVLSCQGRVVDSAETFSTSLVDMMLEDMPEKRHVWNELFTDPVLERRQKRFTRWLKCCQRVAFGHELDAEGVHPPGDEIMTSFSRTMVCGVDGMRNRLPPEMVALFPRYMQWAVHRARSSSGGADPPEEMVGYTAAIDSSIMGLTAGMKFCVTGGGRFGQVPLRTRGGDCVCVLVGGEVPFVVRPTGSGTYTLVGECYVDGLMDGEGLEDEGGGAAVLETIQLE